MIYYRQTIDIGKKNHYGQTEAARQLLTEVLMMEYRMKALPEISREIHGKPYFPAYPQIAFNYSHCRKEILCGVSSKRIGVDIETVRPYKSHLAQRVCHPCEWEILENTEDPALIFTKLWVCKEAYGKYTGTGVFIHPEQEDFSGILQGKELFSEGIYMKLWEVEDCVLGICVEEKEDMQLIFL